jgi:cell division protein FtsB
MKLDAAKRIQQIFGPLIAVTLVIYFIYHLIQGERGILSWMRLKQRIAIAEKRLDEVREEQNALEQRVHLLRPDSLDLDMLEERARSVLNFARKDEIIVHDKELFNKELLDPNLQK